jgi:uncharacterized protein (TIGR02421 family)
MSELESRWRDIDTALVDAAKRIKVLSLIAWPRQTTEEFLVGFRRGQARLPEVDYGPVSLAGDREALAAIMRRCDRGHPIEDFLFRTARSYDRAAEMVENRGRKRFRELSRLLYGEPRQALAADQISTLQAAQRLMETTRDFAIHCAHREEDFCITPEAVANTIREATKSFVHHDIAVIVDDNLSAKAAAGALRIRIRSGTCFSEDDVAQLLHHELFVHSLSALNGRMQPQLKSLGLGAPRTTATQEGLALFSELITNSIDVTRLRRIAARCIGIDLALEGADFIEVFRSFLGGGQSEVEAAASAARVFRGGDVRGGVAFTKDCVYLQGFLRVHEFLRTAIASGDLKAPHRIMAGRVHTNDIQRLAPFFDSGFLAEPVYEPEWLRRRSALVAFLLHTNLVTDLHLEAGAAGSGEEDDEEMPRSRKP